MKLRFHRVFCLVVKEHAFYRKLTKIEVILIQEFCFVFHYRTKKNVQLQNKLENKSFYIKKRCILKPDHNKRGNTETNVKISWSFYSTQLFKQNFTATWLSQPEQYFDLKYHMWRMSISSAESFSGDGGLLFSGKMFCWSFLRRLVLFFQKLAKFSCAPQWSYHDKEVV